MKINKRFLGKSIFTVAVAVLAGFAVSCIDLWSEQHPGTYYINNGQTVASFLEEHPSGQFSDFVYIIKKAGIWGELRTYGNHTCFAPDNAAVQEYLQERYKEAPESKKWQFESLEALPEEICDSVAKTHLCHSTFFCTDMNGDGALPYPNQLDRYLTYSSFADTIWTENRDTFKIELKYRINQQSKIVEPDDTVQNGVVHIIDKVLRPSNEYLPGHLKDVNKTAPYKYRASYFYDALISTHLSDSLEEYLDINYPVTDYDSTYACLETTGKVAVEYTTAYETGDSRQRAIWPEKRYFKFTLFVVTDSILENVYNVKPETHLDDLRKIALNAYPECDPSLPDSSTKSALYKLMSYHILPCWMPYNQLNTSQKEIVDNRKQRDSLDVEDFYESMHPYAVMRISTPLDAKVERKGIYINRKGTVTANNLTHKGIRIWSASEYEKIDNTCSNGGFHYVDSLLLFNDVTKRALNTRMRYMANTLSPDFINSGARGRLRTEAKNPVDYAVYGFKKGFAKNIECSDQTQYFVRYRDPTFGCFYGDEMTIRGIYDFTLRLPPVPSDGTYEVRIWGNSLGSSGQNDRGIAQFYFREGKNGAFNPCGIPVNLGVKSITEPQIGAVMDENIRSNYDTEEEREAAIIANDKAMRNRGYMKAMDSYGSGSNVLRNDQSCFRKIVCNEYMKAGTDYYLRLRQVLENEAAVCPFNIVEIVPKDIYAGDIPEDRH